MRERKAGKILKAIREQAGLSQSELGKYVGYSGVFVGLLESGAKFPASDEIVIGLALACRSDPTELVRAYGHDRAMRWINNRPDHIPDALADRVREIVLDEPVAA